VIKFDALLIPQTPVHEPSLLECHPPFARLACPIGIQPLDQPRRKLLPHLRQILSQIICVHILCISLSVTRETDGWKPTGVRTARGGRIVRIERKVGVAGDGKAIDGERVERFARLELGLRRARRSELGEAVRDEEDEHDERSVGGALDLKIAEERVGAEEVEGLVDDVCARWIGYACVCVCKASLWDRIWLMFGEQMCLYCE
jgi:hypothetical protein